MTTDGLSMYITQQCNKTLNVEQVTHNLHNLSEYAFINITITV